MAKNKSCVNVGRGWWGAWSLPVYSGDCWLALSTLVACKAIEIVARDLGVELIADVAIGRRAEATVRAVELELERMKRAGELRPVTRAYREYRLD